MKLSFSTLGCPNWNIEKTVKMAIQYGFDGVEIRSAEDMNTQPSISCEEKKKIRDLFQNSGIEICCVSGYSKFNSKDEKELLENEVLLKSYVDLAESLGAKRVRTFVGACSEDNPVEEIAKRAIPYLERCGDYALEKGVTIVVETHDSFSSSPVIRLVTDNIKSKGIAILWDVHHPFSHGESAAETVAALGSKIRHLHVKDGVGSELCLMGEGELPIADFVSEMEKIGYDGYYSFEWEKMWIPELQEPEVAFPQYVEYMRKLKK